MEGTESLHPGAYDQNGRRVAATRPAWRVLKGLLELHSEVRSLVAATRPAWRVLKGQAWLLHPRRDSVVAATRPAWRVLKVERKTFHLGQFGQCCSDSTRMEGTERTAVDYRHQFMDKVA